MATPYPKSKYRDGVPLVGHKRPSEAQLAAGNAPKGHTNLHGMRFTIENEAGTSRSGTDDSGKKWKQRMAHDYGYVRGTKGFDKDHIDVFLGPDHQDPGLPVYVVDQNKKGGGSVFDEHKVMMGFKDADDAIMAYHANYEPGWDGFRAVTPMSISDFKTWAYSGKSGKRKPASEYVKFKEGAINGESQSNTGSSSSGNLRQGVQYAGERGNDEAGIPGSEPAGSALEQRNPASEQWELASSNAAGRRLGTAESGNTAAGAGTDGLGRAGEGTGTSAQHQRSGAQPQLRRGTDSVARASGRGSEASARPRSLGERLAAKRTARQAGVAARPDGGLRRDSVEAHAQGGSVQGGEDREPERGDDREGRPFIGYPRANARRSKNDREASASVPGSILRGRAAGIAGLPGDAEGLLRTVARAGRGNPYVEALGRAFPGLRLATEALGSSEDATARLPTSEFYNEWLPGRAEGAVNRAAETAGNFTAPLAPTSDIKALVEGVKRAAPGVKALVQSQAPKIEAALMKAAPAAQPMYAIKPKGGNWFDPHGHIIRESYDLAGEMTPGEPKWIGELISDHPYLEETAGDAGLKWLGKRMHQYMQNEMGTAADPLVKLEREGKLWYDPRNTGPDMTMRRRLESEDPGAAIHQSLTGRTERSPLEVIADSYIEKRQGGKGSMRREVSDILKSEYSDLTPEDFRHGVMPDDPRVFPEWVEKAEERGDPLYALHTSREGFDGVGDLTNDFQLEHLANYLGNATNAHFFGKMGRGAQPEYGWLPEDMDRWQKFLDSGLELDPAKLDRMSLYDVGAKAGEWNKRMEEWALEANRQKDWMKGVKEVMKEYPEGGQWVELNPEALADEGTAMGHCVGGYCKSVEGGNTRILSYRDKEGPHITVELRRPDEGLSDAYERMLANKVEDPRADFGDDEQDKLMQAISEWQAQNPLPWDIMQIKGKGNRAPVDKYQTYAQDLVRNMGPWGDRIRDLHNTGLTRVTRPYAQRVNQVAQGEPTREVKIDPGMYTRDELLKFFTEAGETPEMADMWVRGLPQNGYAEGGSVDDETRPAFRTPMIAKRREDRQDRRGATEVPAQLVRGALAGTLGFGGDVESLGRMAFNALAKKGKEVDSHSVLPTSKFFQEALPLAPSSASGRAAGEAGSLLGVPVSLPATAAARALVKASQKAAEPLIAGRHGARAAQSGAIKLPGGNWFDLPAAKYDLKNTKGSLYDTADDPVHRTPAGAGKYAGYNLNIEDDDAAKWFSKSLQKWMQNEMGTARDPLLKLEAEGRLHLTPEQLQENMYDTWTRRGLTEADPGGSRHFEMTGRNERTPWETRTDSEIKRMTGEHLRHDVNQGGPDARDAVPDWLWSHTASPKNGEFYRFRGANSSEGNMDRLAESLGLNHLADYMNEAMLAGTGDRAKWMEWLDQGTQGDAPRRMLRMHDAGLQIMPKDLQRMGWADFVAKAGDYNRALAKWAAEDKANVDFSKGIKSVMKEYPEGGKWVELNPEALGDEGAAMGHCVGGYCRQVESGDTRIFSYRDADGPHITVEAQKPDYYHRSTQNLLRQEAQKRGLIKSGSDADAVLAQLYDEMDKANQLPWDIHQIKGKGNMAPADKYKPMAQDFVRNLGPWGNEIYDLKNTGLVHMQGGMTNIYDGPEKFRNITMPEGYFTPAEVAEHFMKQGVPERAARQHAGDYSGWQKDMLVPPEDGYAEGGLVDPDDALSDADFIAKYAGGGTVTGKQTVGTGTFAVNPNDQPDQSGWGLQGTGGRQLSGQGGYGGGQSSGGADPAQYMQQLIGSGNPDLLSKVPRWNVNDPDAARQIKEFTKGANAGVDFSGASAFLRAHGGVPWQPGIGGDTGDLGSINQEAMNSQKALAKAFGIDMGTGDWAPGSGGDYANAVSMNNKLNEALKDYRLITGLQPNQQGGNGLKTYETLYKQGQDGMLNPIWAREWARPENHGWAKSESGGSFLQAASMMLPAVGGWAGLASQAAGTTGATAANIAGNAALGYIRGGTQGALGSLASGLGGYAGGQAGGWFGGSTGQALGQQIGQQGGSYLVNRRKTGGLVSPLNNPDL